MAGRKRTARPRRAARRAGIELRSDALRILMLVADSARPIVLDEIARLAPGPARDVRDIVEELRDGGLVDLSDQQGVGTVVSITDKGRAARTRA